MFFRNKNDEHLNLIIFWPFSKGKWCLDSLANVKLPNENLPKSMRTLLVHNTLLD
jgi:hypothetical protein